VNPWRPARAAAWAAAAALAWLGWAWTALGGWAIVALALAALLRQRLGERRERREGRAHWTGPPLPRRWGTGLLLILAVVVVTGIAPDGGVIGGLAVGAGLLAYAER
jgi:hypothetical protein